MQRPPRTLFTACAILVLATSSALAAPQEESRELLPILAKSMEYHGVSVWQSSQVSGLLQSQSGTFALRSRRKGEGYDYFVVIDGRPEGKPTTEYRLNNLRVAKLVGGEEVELATPEARREATDFVMERMYTTLLPFLLGEPDVKAEDLGVETWGERPLHRVEVTHEQGKGMPCANELVFWFDPETGRLEQFAYSFDGGLRFRQLMHHSRNHGIVLANQKNFGVAGEGLTLDQITSEFVAESMEELEPVLFDPVRVRLLR